MKSAALLAILFVALNIHIPGACARVFQVGPEEFLTRLAVAVDDKINFLLKFMLPQMPYNFPLDGPLELSIPAVITLDGSLKDAFVNGIPKTKAHLAVDKRNSMLTFALANEYMKLFGREYIINGLLLTTGTRFNGSGIIAAELKNLDFFLSTKLVIDPVENKLSIEKTDIKVSFESFLIELQNLEVNGVLVNWDDINHKINKDFHQEWPKVKSHIIQELEKEVNDNLKGLTLGDILQLVGA